MDHCCCTWLGQPMADLIPPSIRDDRTRGLVGLLDRLDLLPFSVVANLYDPATCPSSALPFLAHQFGILDEGWALATSDAARRTFVAQALTLQAKRGTAWAMRQALAAIGWPGLAVVERSTHWANFKVTQPLPPQPVTKDQVARILAVIERWKPARCVLEAVEFAITFDSAVPGIGPRHDGTHLHGGLIKYEGLVLSTISYVRLGAGGLTLRIDALTISDLADRVVVSFTVDAATGNGLDLDTYAVFTAADTLITQASAPAVHKTSAVTLAVVWIIRKT